ncbi:MAG TPA: hypothetical protein VJZ76_24125 [Thermoanaerobaculia bacterium]|nr:hypothetical protein [Thermoanaerobaculia bacterium]
MKKLLLILLVLAALIGAAAIYLRVTTPDRSRGVAFPIRGADHEMLAHVPASAEAFALVPTAAALDAKLRGNPITRDVVASWTAEQKLPEPWMIGGADLLAWRANGATRYYLRLDPVRAFLVRVYSLLFGETVLINAPAEEAIAAEELQRIEALAAKLPAGDALVVQRASGRGAFPPIARPAVSSIAVEPDKITIVSRAESTDPPSSPLNASFPKSAMLAATFREPPRLVEDLNRLLGGVKVAALMSGGGALALYDVEVGKLLPRPVGVIAVPAERRAEFQNFVDLARQGEALGYQVRTAERDGQLLLSFDRSLDLYLKDTFAPRPLPSARWAVRADPAKLLPILSQLNDNLGLRIATPRISRGVKDADRWFSALGRASAIDVVDSTDGAAEQLSVEIAGSFGPATERGGAQRRD